MKNFLFVSLIIISLTTNAHEVVHNDPSTTTFNNSLTPDGDRVYFTQVSSDFTRISIKEGLITDGRVIQVRPVIIDGVELDGTDVHISPDGQFMLYSARTPFNSPDVEMADYQLYISERIENQWSTPVALPETINSASDEFYPSLTSSGDIYFARRMNDDNLDIFVSRYIDNEYQQAERLGDEVNSPILEGDPFISPEGNYMIFARMKPADGLGMTDMYISYASADGWSKAQNMRGFVNSEGIDGSPFVSRDGKWLYFTSNREGANPEAFDNSLGIYRVPMLPVPKVSTTNQVLTNQQIKKMINQS